MLGFPTLNVSIMFMKICLKCQGTPQGYHWYSTACMIHRDPNRCAKMLLREYEDIWLRCWSTNWFQIACSCVVPDADTFPRFYWMLPNPSWSGSLIRRPSMLSFCWINPSHGACAHSSCACVTDYLGPHWSEVRDCSYITCALLMQIFKDILFEIWNIERTAFNESLDYYV